MPSPLIKILGICGGLATVGGGATAIYLNTNPAKTEQKPNPPSKPSQDTLSDSLPLKAEANKTIASLLKDKKLLSKTDSDNTKWQPQWEAFKKAHEQSPPTSPWEFTNWTGIKDTGSTIDTFKEQCDKHSKKSVTGESDPIFVAVNTYCTESVGAV